MKYSMFETIDQPIVQGFDLTTLRIDEAYVEVVKNRTDAYVYQVHKECHKCAYELVDLYFNHFRATFQYKFIVSSEKSQYLPRDATENVTCFLDPNFGEFGYYQLTIRENDCAVAEIAEPVDAYLPILTVLIVYAIAFFGIYGINFLYKWKTRDKATKEEKPPKKARVKALDTFRGVAIVLMIFANYGCGSYDFCDHSIWNGLHFADLVFPWFMWIMGACIPLSIESSLKRKVAKSAMMQNILKRSIKLFCLGIFLNFSIGFDELRIFGVLQRFGVCYLAASTICVFLMSTNSPQTQNFFTKYFQDILRIALGWAVALGLLVIHCLIIFLVADDKCPAGYLGPGGLHEDLSHFHCTGGATGFIDRTILGNHAFKNPTIKSVYQTTQPFDPEGILGCLTSIFHTFIGVQAGLTLITYKTHSERLIRWSVWAVATGMIGGLLCGFSKDDGIIPVNKNLWSLSFVMVTSCFAFALLSFCYLLIDVKKAWSGKPFLYAGMNAILMYIGHEMANNNFPARWRLEMSRYHPTHFVALMENVWGATFWVAVSYYLYKIKYFFTI